MSDLIRRKRAITPVRYERQQTPEPEIWFDEYSNEHEPDLLRYWRIIFKRRYLVLGVVLMFLAVATVITLTMTPLYKSSVTIQIDPEEKLLSYQLEDERFSGRTTLETQVTVLKSLTLTQSVLESLQNSGRLRSRLTSENLEVKVIPGTQIVRVSYTSEDPQFTAAVVNTMAERYMEYNFQSKYEAVTKARDFLQEEIQEMKLELERSEEKLTQYAREHGILNMAEGENLVVKKLADLSAQTTQLEGQLFANRYGDINSATVEDFPEDIKTAKMRTLEAKVSNLDLELARLASQFGPKWPEVRKLRDELSAAREQLVQETRKAIEQEGIEYELLNEHRSRLTRAVEEQTQLVSNLRENLIQYNILLRDVDTDRELYDGLLRRIKEAGISAGLRSSNIRVLDSGMVPLRPYIPNTLFNLALGLGLGLMIGCALALSLEVLDKSLKTSEDVEEKLGLPCLSVIPALELPMPELGQKLLTRKNGESGDEQIVPYLRSMPQVGWESYRALRTSLLLSSGGKPPQTILVTSALPGEGKSTTSVNLGISLAQAGARTLIMELDMRKPQLAQTLNVQEGLGMSTYLSGNSELAEEIRETNIPNLFLIPGGPIPPNPPELIGSERMQLAIQLLSRHFEFLVIDTPPIISVTDAVVLSPHVDGVILVIEGGKTPKEAVLKARNRLASAGAKILGALMNKVDVHKGGYDYDIRHDYGNYYSSSHDA